MREILFEYDLHPTTWVYVSSLMMIGIYFKFHRLWSVRNLDLIGLIAFAPGLLLVTHDQEELGYTWLFCVNGFFLVRLLLDPVMVRRPLLEPNLSASGLTFTGVALLLFLITRVATVNPEERDRGYRRLEQILAQEDAPSGNMDLSQRGPGYRGFYVLAGFADQAFVPKKVDKKVEAEDAHDARAEEGAADTRKQADEMKAERLHIARAEERAAKIVVIVALVALVLGMVLIGYRHFDNIHAGVAVASLYLLLPYSAQIPTRVDHLVPAALLVWAVAAYRRPIVAGVLLGLVGGLIYYPLFLLPLWCGFYWRRGLVRFASAVVLTLVLMVATLPFTPGNWGSCAEQSRQMFGWINPLDVQVAGFWEYHELAYRIPVVVMFVVLSVSLALWPPQKNLGSLLSCSAAVMLGTQFWQARYGGICMAWYLPLLLLTIFRPNLEDRVALSAVSDLRIRWRRKRPPEKTPAPAPAAT